MKSLMLVVAVLLCLPVRANGELSKRISSESDWANAFALILSLESSGGEKNLIGDKGESFGSFQIQDGYLQDALTWARKNPLDENAKALLYWDKKLSGLTPQKLLGAPTTIPCSIVRCYMARWAGPQPTLETVLRTHNGGPKDPKKIKKWVDKTDPYIARAKEALR